MFLTQLVAGALTQNNPIALSSTPTLVTNSNVSLNNNNNGLIISTPGIYKVRLQANITSGGTDIGAVLYANGNEVAMTEVNVSVASTDDGEIVIEYPVEVVSAPSPNQALVQFYATQGGTVVTGYVTVERIQ